MGMIVECSRCGAPLEVQRGHAFAQCTYCGHSNRVKSARTLMLERPAGWAPPPVWTPPPHVPAPSGQPLPWRAPTPRSSSHAPLIAVGVAAALLVAGTIVPVLFLLTPTSRPSTPTRPTPRAPREQAPDAELRPTIAALPVRAGDASRSWTGTTSGDVNAWRQQPGCSLHAPAAPHLVLEATAPTGVQLVARPTSTTRVGLIVRRPSGQIHCEERSGPDRGALLLEELPRGRTAVWVGVSFGDSQAPFELALHDGNAGRTAAWGLEPGAAPRAGTLDLSGRRRSERFEGTVRADIDARGLDPGCRGWFGAGPTVTVRAADRADLELFTEGREDLTLLVQHPDGSVACDDDSGRGLNPRLLVTHAGGLMRVWVGAYQRSNAAPFELHVAELAAERGSRRRGRRRSGR